MQNNIPGKDFKTWAEAFRHVRILREFSINDVVRRCSVSRKEVEDWEKGIAYPTKGRVMGQLYGNLHALRNYKHLLPTELQEGHEKIEAFNVRQNGLTHHMELPAEVGDEPPPELPPEVKDKPWNDVLRWCRTDRGLSRNELASKAGVVPRTIENWEFGHVAPSKEKWDAVVEVLPRLAQVKVEFAVQNQPPQRAVTWASSQVIPVVQKPDDNSMVALATKYAESLARLKAAKSAHSDLETKLIEAQLAVDGAKGLVDRCQTEADELHKKLMEAAS